jgi:hypothetical protein
MGVFVVLFGISTALTVLSPPEIAGEYLQAPEQICQWPMRTVRGSLSLIFNGNFSSWAKLTE